ncbi:MAG: ZrgA family zinc uptake protein [Geminicoccaceae bacterium]
MKHGHNVLNIAIEGDRIEMEMIAPGADIVGFEHVALSEKDKASHNEFHAACALTCSASDGSDGIDFVAFFESFAGAQEVDVTVISEKGQSSYEVERDAPIVDLQGVM